MAATKTVSCETPAGPVARPRRHCAEHALSGSCPVCQGTLPCDCAQAYAAVQDAGTLPKFARLGAVARVLRLQSDGVPIEMLPFDPEHVERCNTCAGDGYHVEGDEDGEYRVWCRPCGGTGQRVLCSMCVGDLEHESEPDDTHRARWVLRAVSNPGAPVEHVLTRRLCERPEHLGAALIGVVGWVRHKRECAAQDAAREAEQQAAIERSELLGEGGAR